jgi:magnesium and cobalt transporter
MFVTMAAESAIDKERGRSRLWRLLTLPFTKTSPARDGLEEVIEEYREEGKVITQEERTILHNMLEAADLSARDVMVPRHDIVAVEYDITLSELKETFIKQQHTRMPVYDASLDKLKGFLHLKDVVPALAGDEPFDMDQVLREIYFISPSMKIVDLLVQMRVSGHHLAIVVDEYGGTDGLVTLEDVIEALVGEIQDEHDVEDGEVSEYKRISSHQFELDARMMIEDLQAILGVDLFALLPSEEDVDSMGGLLFAILHRVPVTGEIIAIGDIGQAKIVEADPRRIKRILLTLTFTPLAAIPRAAHAIS